MVVIKISYDDFYKLSLRQYYELVKVYAKVNGVDLNPPNVARWMDEYIAKNGLYS